MFLYLFQKLTLVDASKSLGSSSSAVAASANNNPSNDPKESALLKYLRERADKLKRGKASSTSRTNRGEDGKSKKTSKSSSLKTSKKSSKKDEGREESHEKRGKKPINKDKRSTESSSNDVEPSSTPHAPVKILTKVNYHLLFYTPTKTFFLLEFIR